MVDDHEWVGALRSWSHLTGREEEWTRLGPAAALRDIANDWWGLLLVVGAAEEAAKIDKLGPQHRAELIHIETAAEGIAVWVFHDWDDNSRCEMRVALMTDRGQFGLIPAHCKDVLAYAPKEVQPKPMGTCKSQDVRTLGCRNVGIEGAIVSASTLTALDDCPHLRELGARSDSWPCVRLVIGCPSLRALRACADEYLLVADCVQLADLRVRDPSELVVKDCPALREFEVTASRPENTLLTVRSVELARLQVNRLDWLRDVEVDSLSIQECHNIRELPTICVTSSITLRECTQLESLTLANDSEANLDLRNCPLDVESLQTLIDASVKRARFDNLEHLSSKMLKHLSAQTTTLSVAGSPITDLSFLAELKCLEELVLSDCFAISSLQSLGHLKALRKLRARNLSRLGTLNGLQNCARLTELDISGSSIVDASAIAQLELQRLDCSRCVRIKRWPSFPATLKYVDLSSTRAEGWSTVRSISGLQTLRARNVPREVLPPLHAKSLLHLELSENDWIESMEPWRGATQLESLLVTDCPQLHDSRRVFRSAVVVDESWRDDSLEALSKLPRCLRSLHVALLDAAKNDLLFVDRCHAFFECYAALLVDAHLATGRKMPDNWQDRGFLSMGTWTSYLAAVAELATFAALLKEAKDLRNDAAHHRASRTSQVASLQQLVTRLMSVEPFWDDVEDQRCGETTMMFQGAPHRLWFIRVSQDRVFWLDDRNGSGSTFKSIDHRIMNVTDDVFRSRGLRIKRKKKVWERTGEAQS